jgi:TonB family protein
MLLHKNTSSEHRIRKMILGWMSMLALVSACGHPRLAVSSMPNPSYPIDALLKNLQGVVNVEMDIDADGKVRWAKGNGSDPVLVEAAEENARDWVFKSLPAHDRFPIKHTIAYTFRLEGKPMYVAVQPKITADLPDRVEVVGTPLIAEKTTLIPAERVAGGALNMSAPQFKNGTKVRIVPKKPKPTS